MPLTPEHLAARLKGVGGSDLPAILDKEIASAGDKVYGCPRALWYEKTGVPADYEFEEHGYIRRGVALEPIVAEIYTEETGNKVRNLRHRVNPDRPWEMVSIDRQIVGTDRGVGILECKTVGRAIWYQIKANGLPLRFVIQVQWGLHVLGPQYTWGVDAVLWPDGWEHHFFTVERDQDLIDLIAAKVKEFWQSVQSGAIPDKLKYNDPRCQSCRWRSGCQGEELLAEAATDLEEFQEQITDESLAPKVKLRMELKNIISEADERKTELEGDIVEAMAGKKIIIAGGHKITHIPQPGGYIADTKKLKKDPEIWDKYKKPKKGSQPLKFYPI